MTHAGIRRSFNRFVAIQFAALLAVVAVLLASRLAGAATFEETDCRAVPLTQAARPGETVVVCELRRVPSRVSKAPSVPQVRRAGRTTVVHYGARSVRVASR